MKRSDVRSSDRLSVCLSVSPVRCGLDNHARVKAAAPQQRIVDRWPVATRCSRFAAAQAPAPEPDCGQRHRCDPKDEYRRRLVLDEKRWSGTLSSYRHFFDAAAIFFKVSGQ